MLVLRSREVRFWQRRLVLHKLPGWQVSGEHRPHLVQLRTCRTVCACGSRRAHPLPEGSLHEQPRQRFLLRVSRGTVSGEHRQDWVHGLPGRICDWRWLRRCQDRPFHVLALPRQHLLCRQIGPVHVMSVGHAVQQRAHWLRVLNGPAVQLPIQALLQLPRRLLPGFYDPHCRCMQELPERQDLGAWRELLRMRSGQVPLRLDMQGLRRWQVPRPVGPHEYLLQQLHRWSHVPRRGIQVQLPAGPLVQALSWPVCQVRRGQVHGRVLPRDRGL